MMRKPVSIALGVALSVSLCGPILANEPVVLPAKTPGNTIVIRVVGLPATASPRVVVRGPSGFRKSVLVSKKKRVLRDLSPGPYSLSPRPAAGRLPISQRLLVQVSARKGAVARLYYSKTGTR